jgi:hypothetical protein
VDAVVRLDTFEYTGTVPLINDLGMYDSAEEARTFVKQYSKFTTECSWDGMKNQYSNNPSQTGRIMGIVACSFLIAIGCSFVFLLFSLYRFRDDTIQGFIDVFYPLESRTGRPPFAYFEHILGPIPESSSPIRRRTAAGADVEPNYPPDGNAAPPPRYTEARRDAPSDGETPA